MLQRWPREAGRSLRRGDVTLYDRLAVIFIVLQALLLWCGLSRMPLAPALGDELIINDPAVSLSRGGALVAPSLGGSVVGLDKLYAHFPPVYIFLQAGMLKVFGVSAISLRALSVISLTLATLTFAAILRLLLLQQLLSARMAALALLLLCLEPDTIALTRFARMDPTVLLFALLAFFFVLRSHLASNLRTTLLTVGMLCAGLCLATHLEGVVAILPALILALPAPGTRSMLKRLPLLLIPFILLASIWGITYHRESFAALQQMGRIAKYAPGPGVFDLISNGLHAGNGEAFRSSGLVLIFYCSLAWLLTLLFAIAYHPSTRKGLPVYLFWSFVGSAVLDPLLLIFAFPASITRWFVVFPFALMGAVVVTGSIERRRTMLWAVIAPVMASEIIGLGFYFNALFKQWSRRAPDRFAVIGQRVDSGDKILAEGQFWLTLERSPHHLTVLYPELGATTEWLLTSGCNRIAPFDVVILNEGNPDFVPLATEARKGRSDWSGHVGGEVVHVFRASPPDRNGSQNAENSVSTCP
jgi:4-amino-4-deoxy-L-arabinose transferase-like glycosyltransferase